MPSSDLLDLALLHTASLVEWLSTFTTKPQVLIETSGPDQIDQFLSGVGTPDGIFVPNSWWPDSPVSGNAEMIAAYITHYHVAKASVSSDVAQAYSAAQVMQQAVELTHTLDNQKLIRAMHQTTFNTVQGAVRFDSMGAFASTRKYVCDSDHRVLF